MRVLMSAYTCSPNRGSETGAGWAFLRAAARSHDVVLLTSPCEADALSAALREDGLRPVRVVWINGPLERFRGGLGLGHLDYLVWQYRAWKFARAHEHEVDVAHHVTYGMDWSPSALHFLRHVPVVWGPVGGTAPAPWRLWRYLSPRGIAREVTREVATRSNRVVTRALVRRSRPLVVATNREVAEFWRRAGVPVVVEAQAAVPPLALTPPARLRSDGKKKAVFVARLAAWKGPYLALQALAALPDEWTLDMYGGGPEEPAIRRRAERLGITRRVQVLGNRPRDEVQQALVDADVLLFPSMHDASGFAVAEAMRVGCPVVCLDVGGPAMLIEGTQGIAVEPDGDAPRNLARAMGTVRRGQPSDRWSTERLAGRVTEWYDAVVRDFPAVDRGTVG